MTFHGSILCRGLWVERHRCKIIKWPVSEEEMYPANDLNCSKRLWTVVSTTRHTNMSEKLPNENGGYIFLVQQSRNRSSPFHNSWTEQRGFPVTLSVSFAVFFSSVCSVVSGVNNVVTVWLRIVGILLPDCTVSSSRRPQLSENRFFPNPFQFTCPTSPCCVVWLLKSP
jgi:hypothetical protein